MHKGFAKRGFGMRANVDQNVCIGCGLCAGMVPEVFRMNDDGKAEAYQDAAPENESMVQDAIYSCPVSAIQWEE